MSKELSLDQCTDLEDLTNLAPAEFIRHSNKTATSLAMHVVIFRLNEIFNLLAAGKVETGDKPRREAQELIEAEKALDDADVLSVAQGRMLSIPERIKLLADRVS